jgi:hypothetical protein
MPRIIVKNAQVEERSVNGKNGPSILRSQMACLDLGNGYEQAFRIGLGKNPPYQPGEYDIDPKSFTLGRYGDLELSRYVDLLPLTVKPASASVKAV